jgi:hypothetical protein
LLVAVFVGGRATVQPGESAECGEALGCAWPVLADGLQAGAAHDGAEYGRDDDGVVGVAKDGDEVGYRYGAVSFFATAPSRPPSSAAFSIVVASTLRKLAGTRT